MNLHAAVDDRDGDDTFTVCTHNQSPHAIPTCNPYMQSPHACLLKIQLNSDMTEIVLYNTCSWRLLAGMQAAGVKGVMHITTLRHALLASTIGK